MLDETDEMLDETDEILDETDEILDDSWITQFEDLNARYDRFYSEDVNVVNTTLFFLNTFLNEIIHRDKDVVVLKTPGCVSQDELAKMMKKNQTRNGVLFKPMYILKYNINIAADEVKFLGRGEKDFFWTSVTDVNDIHYEKTIGCFQDLNDLVIIFQPESPRTCNKTKRLFFRSKHKKTLKCSSEAK